MVWHLVQYVVDSVGRHTFSVQPVGHHFLSHFLGLVPLCELPLLLPARFCVEGNGEHFVGFATLPGSKPYQTGLLLSVWSRLWIAFLSFALVFDCHFPILHLVVEFWGYILYIERNARPIDFFHTFWTRHGPDSSNQIRSHRLRQSELVLLSFKYFPNCSDIFLSFSESSRVPEWKMTWSEWCLMVFVKIVLILSVHST